MIRRFLIASAALALTGCGVPEYFDQHPANVRPESEAVAAALHQQQYGQAIASGTASASAQARTAIVPAKPLRATSPLPPAVEGLAESGSSAPKNSAQVSGSASLPANAPGGSAVVNSSTLERAAAIPAPTNSAHPIKGEAANTEPRAPVLFSAPNERPLPNSQTSASPKIPADQAETDKFETPSRAATIPDQRAISQTLPDVAGNMSAVSSVPAPNKDAVGVSPGLSAETLPPSAEPVRSAPRANSVSSAHCQSVARTRADDAAAAGQDSETQRMVREGTYANCVAWEVAHHWHD